MKKNLSPKEWANEFDEFVSADPVNPPVQLSNQILSNVQSDLNPSVWSVFSKITFIHFVTGMVSLLFCPQFGVSPFHEHHGLMEIFMNLGKHGCMLGCGAVFLGTGGLATSLILRPEEVRTVMKTKFLQFSLLSALSIGAFICAGADVVLNLAVAWFIGSVLGGLLTLELGWKIRARFRSKVVYGI